MPLYVVEPDYWRLPDTSARQWRFIKMALEELADDLAKLGAPLVVRCGDVVEVLAALCSRHTIAGLYAHEETGNSWTFARDQRVQAFCRERAMALREIPQFGVVRGLRDRDHWAAAFGRFMTLPLVAPPRRLVGVTDIASDALPEPSDLGLADDGLEILQRPGRRAGLALLDSFFTGRGRHYVTSMSSPLNAETACSRLSPHLASGALSMREVIQRAYRERRKLADVPPDMAAISPRAIDALVSRLHWHCHFIQKLESEPQIESRAQHRLFRDVTYAPAPGHFAAWCEGRTGFPFLDACMRYLIARGWINFRMRAMLMSFASHHLGLDWRLSGAHLARMFVDYEPGIHWPQVQMQSGLTGINVPRIYNPVKQSRDQDSAGDFIRAHVPELKRLAPALVHEPWLVDPITLAAAGVELGVTYPRPIIDLSQALSAARLRLSAVRHAAGFRQEARAVHQKHGSRAGPHRKAKANRPVSRQLTLDL